MNLNRVGIPNLINERLSKKVKMDLVNSIYHSEFFRLSLKVDGFSFRIGRESHEDGGRPFVATARSEKIYHPDKFIEFACYRASLNPLRCDDIMERAYQYHDLFKFILNSDIMGYINPGSVHWCEMIYTPMCDVEDGLVRQVSVWYPQDKLGNLLTIVPWKTPDGEWIHSDHVGVKIVDPFLIEISGDMIRSHFDYLGLPKPEKFQDLIEKLQSRKHIDRSINNVYMSVIDSKFNRIRQDLRTELLNSQVGVSDILGSSIEGVVVECSDGNKFKIEV